MIEIIDKSSTNAGTDINRETLMAMQGFIAQTITFNDDGSITEVNSKGQTKTTVFNADGSVTETFVGEKTITKTTYFEGNTIREVLG